jgi:tRNA A-37 threonylcarbamoyl transferase component Bud32
MRTHLIYARSPIWAEIAAHAEDLMSGAGFEPVKDEAKTRAGFVALEDGTQVFIKRFSSGPRARGLWTRIRGSRAWRSIRGARLLQSHGFRCPEPYAALEIRRGVSVPASYLLSEPLRKAQILSRFLLARPWKPGTHLWRRVVLAKVAGEIRRLHDAGVFTSDLQEANMMLQEVGGETRIYFVDLDGFRRPRTVAWRLRERNLVQLDRSLGRFFKRSARLRFLYAYLGGKPERRKARRLVTSLLGRRQREDRRREIRTARGQARRDAAARSLSAD